MMKVKLSSQINLFGGLNFVFEDFEKIEFDNLLEEYLPSLAPQSQYSWKDIIFSLFGIYFCGGDCIEDIGGNLKHNLANNPFVNVPSPDRILDRLKELSNGIESCFTKRGIVEHQYSVNNQLCRLNIALLKKMGVLSQEELTIDYDNTILFNEKLDSKMTFKRGTGYQPGVATINVNHILYSENRNGNSDAKSFQAETLQRMFIALEEQGIDRISNFRADGASYQFDVVNMINKYVDKLYISARISYVNKHFEHIAQWQEFTDSQGDTA